MALAAAGISGRRAALADALRRPALLSLLDQGAVSGFGFLAGIAAARLVDMQAFGRFALVMIMAGFAQGLHNALVTSPLMTLAGAGAGRRTGYRSTVLVGTILLALAMAAGVALVLALYFVARGDPVPVELAAAAAALTLAQNLQLTIRRMLFAFGGGARALAMDLLRALAFPVAVAMSWACGLTPSAPLLVWILAGTALVATLPGIARGGWAPPRRWRPRAAATRHWRLARWLLPVVLVTYGQEQLVWVLAGGTLGDDALGGLRAAQYLVGLVLLLLAATENVVPTGAGRAYAEGGDAALAAYLRGVLRRLGPPVAVLLVAVAVPADLWLRLVFGAAYGPYAPCVQWLALGVAFILVRDMASQVFRARRRTDVIFKAFAVSLVVALALLKPLLERYGAAGAAADVTLGHGASMLYLVWAARRAPAPRNPAPC